MDALSEAAADLWVEVGSFGTTADAEQHALVLVAAGIRARLVPDLAQTALLVERKDAARAQDELAAYDAENRPPPRRETGLQPLSDGINAALLYCVLLVAFHAAATRGALSADWLERGASQAGLFRAGEWWRPVTALFLHADVEHLMSNVALGALLGLLLAQVLRPGLAWLAILLAGAMGNALVASAAPAEHASIGASTAVFGALGLLAATAWRHQAQLWRGLRRFRPIAAAIMLLALLGMGGERTDIWGHVAGLGCGLAIGAALQALRDRLPQTNAAQSLYGSAAAALVAAAWLAALVPV